MYIQNESEDLFMGDMIKKTGARTERKSLEERAAEREVRKQETVHTGNDTIEKITKNAAGKDKPISARVNGTTYIKFKKICAARGITSNACLNMLITDFVRENKSVIEE